MFEYWMAMQVQNGCYVSKTSTASARGKIFVIVLTIEVDGAGAVRVNLLNDAVQILGAHLVVELLEDLLQH